MDYFEFEKEFKKKTGQLKLPSGSAMQTPLVKASLPPLGWTLEFFVQFDDGMHIRIWESYTKIAGLFASRKSAWAYHYGPVTPGQVRSDGTLAKGTCADPLILRLDTANIGPHLHLNTQEPHYKQEQIIGMSLVGVDCWQFIKGILKHRQTGKTVTEVFGFKIKE